MLIPVHRIGDIFRAVIDSVNTHAQKWNVSFQPSGVLAFLEPSVNYFQNHPVPSHVDTVQLDGTVDPIVGKFQGQSNVGGGDVAAVIASNVPCHFYWLC